MSNKEYEKFVKRMQLERPAENTKLAVLVILFFSVGIFSGMSSEAIKSVIWYWSGFMGALLIACLIQDILISRKIKKL